MNRNESTKLYLNKLYGILVSTIHVTQNNHKECAENEVIYADTDGTIIRDKKELDMNKNYN